MERSGSWVFSSTIELVPRREDDELKNSDVHWGVLKGVLFLSPLTQFDDDGEGFLFHFDVIKQESGWLEECRAS